MSSFSGSSSSLKKKFGQHFLRDQSIADAIVSKVQLTAQDSVFEIGGGDGFLTKTILQKPLARLWVFEIDPHWASVLKKIPDDRLTIVEQDFLTVDYSLFVPYKPWTLLANVPYQITFPILYTLQEHRELLKEGVIMIQEEVAQKIVQKGGRGYGYHSLFFQWFFEWELMQKIPPTAFLPPPNVYSRLLYFKPKVNIPPIKHEEQFWKFIKFCFLQPRRTLKNNLITTHYEINKIPESILLLRAQQMTMDDFLKVWDLLQ